VLPAVSTSGFDGTSNAGRPVSAVRVGVAREGVLRTGSSPLSCRIALTFTA
jgi:hypothetical protein